jgi:hypothetical protein
MLLHLSTTSNKGILMLTMLLCTAPVIRAKASHRIAQCSHSVTVQATVTIQLHLHTTLSLLLERDILSDSM